MDFRDRELAALREMHEPTDVAESNPNPVRPIPYSEVPADGQAPLVISNRGRFVGLNPVTARQGQAELIVSIDDQGGRFFIAPGQVISVAREFKRLFLNRPSWVPSDATRSFYLDVWHRDGQLKYGPLPIAAQLAGAEQIAAARVQATGLINGVIAAPQLVAARVGRRFVKIKNLATVPELAYVATSPTPGSPTWDPQHALTTIVDEIDPGDTLTLPYTGALYAVSSTGEFLRAVEYY